MQKDLIVGRITKLVFHAIFLVLGWPFLDSSQFYPGHTKGGIPHGDIGVRQFDPVIKLLCDACIPNCDIVGKCQILCIVTYIGHYISTLYITYIRHYISALFNLSFMFIHCHKR